MVCSSFEAQQMYVTTLETAQQKVPLNEEYPVLLHFAPYNACLFVPHLYNNPNG